MVQTYRRQGGFNPRARDGRELKGVAAGDKAFVSIHAPVMDANTGHLFTNKDNKFQSTRP